MEHGVELDVRKLDARGPVMRFRKLYSFLLVESEPLRRIGFDIWVRSASRTLLLAASAFLSGALERVRSNQS
jgi:hypothetical protein